MLVSINIKDQLSPQLDRVKNALIRLRPLHAKLGGELAKMLRKHFSARQREPNKRGWPKRKFWTREGRQNTSVTAVSDTGAEVTIASAAIAFKTHGGVIKAKRGRMLAIPLTARAYAAGSPREGGIKGLFFTKTKKSAVLAIALGKNKKIEPQYALKASVRQNTDPNAVPAENKIDEHVRRTADEWLAEQISAE